MARTRKAVVDLVTSWIGKNEADGSYKEIIDIYNSYKGGLPRGLKMQYDWAWCGCTWSALAIKLGYTMIMPIEISCKLLIDQAIKMGCWVENDEYIAKIGDGILYDWDDTGLGDNVGWPDHIGVITEVNTAKKYYTVVEGNRKNAVSTRKVNFNGKFIRGFITPMYDDADLPAKEVVAKNKPKHLDKAFSKWYTVTTDLNCRDGAGTANNVLVKIPQGTNVRCYGYYDVRGGVRWLYVQFNLKNVTYNGFCSSKYLALKG